MQFGRLVVVVVVGVVVVVVVVVVVAKEEKDTQNTEKKKKQRMKTDKNAHYWPFLALFQGKEICLAYVVNSFSDDPFLFGLNSCMTQQNKWVVSKNFYNIRKNRVAYLEIKWKRQKDLQFGRLVVVVVVVVVVVGVVVVVVVVVVVAKEEKDTQNTQKKKKQRMKTDKNAHYWPFLALFQGKELCLAYVVISFWDDTFLFGLNSCMTQQNKGSYQKIFTT